MTILVGRSARYERANWLFILKIYSSKIYLGHKSNEMSPD
jgi:hypothetical protein